MRRTSHQLSSDSNVDIPLTALYACYLRGCLGAPCSPGASHRLSLLLFLLATKMSR